MVSVGHVGQVAQERVRQGLDHPIEARADVGLLQQRLPSGPILEGHRAEHVGDFLGVAGPAERDVDEASGSRMHRQELDRDALEGRQPGP